MHEADKGMEDERSGLFRYVPPVIEAIAEALEATGVRFGLIEENVRMEDKWLRYISEHLAVKPIQLGTASVSMADRTRLFWTSVPFHPSGQERMDEKDFVIEATLQGSPAAG